MAAPLRTIALEEHSTFEGLGDDRPFYNEIWKVFPQVRQALLDHSMGRIADMDEGHVTFQVMSHLPGIANFKIDGCRKANDEMAIAIRARPDRFAGFAALPMGFPKESSLELERAVRNLGLQGAMIDNHLEDMTHYDDEKFWPVFEMAEKLDVPIYIHPAPCSEDTLRGRFNGNYSSIIAQGLSTGGWGWHEDVGLHVLKLYAAGLFDRFPDLKLIIGHMGELLPIWIDRVDDLRFFQKAGLKKFEDIWNKNIWVTSSGIFSVRNLDMVLKTTKIERLLYSIDTPFNKSKLGWRFLQDIAESGLLSREELNMFAFGNAKNLLKLSMQIRI